MSVSTVERLSPAESFDAVVAHRLETYQDPNCTITIDGFVDKAIRLFSHDVPLGDTEVPEAKLGLVSADQPRRTGLVTGPVVNVTSGFESELYYVHNGQLLHRAVDSNDVGELWYNPGLDEPLSDTKSQQVVDYVRQLQERPSQIYKPESSGKDFWSLRCRLPKALPRQTVLDELFYATLDMQNYFHGLSSAEIAAKGLSGALVGKNDAEFVEEVIFAQETSRRHGIRKDDDSDVHAFRIAESLGWKEINYGPRNEDMAPKGYMRSIMGRNRNLYSGKDGAFSIDETRAMLGRGNLLRLTEGYLWSARPTWNKPYGEPAAIVEARAMSQSRQNTVLKQMGELAWALNWQHRWLAEIADLPKRSSLVMPPPKMIAFQRNVLS